MESSFHGEQKASSHNSGKNGFKMIIVVVVVYPTGGLIMIGTLLIL